MGIGNVVRGRTRFVSIVVDIASSTTDREFAEEASNSSTSSAATAGISRIMSVWCCSGEGGFVHVGDVTRGWRG